MNNRTNQFDNSVSHLHPRDTQGGESKGLTLQDRRFFDEFREEVFPTPPGMAGEYLEMYTDKTTDYETAFLNGSKIHESMVIALRERLGADPTEELLAQEGYSAEQYAQKYFEQQYGTAQSEFTKRPEIWPHIEALLTSSPAGAKFRTYKDHILMSFKNEVDPNFESDNVHVLFNTAPAFSSKKKGLKMEVTLQENGETGRVFDMSGYNKGVVDFHFKKKGIFARIREAIGLGSVVANASGEVFSINKSIVTTIAHETVHAHRVKHIEKNVEKYGIRKRDILSVGAYMLMRGSIPAALFVGFSSIAAAYAINPWFLAVPFLTYGTRVLLGYPMSRSPRNPVGKIHHLILGLEREARFAQEIFNRILQNNGFTAGYGVIDRSLYQYAWEKPEPLDAAIRNIGYQGGTWGAIDLSREPATQERAGRQYSPQPNPSLNNPAFAF